MIFRYSLLGKILKILIHVHIEKIIYVSNFKIGLWDYWIKFSKKSERKVGSQYRQKDADEIFDMLDEHDQKDKTKLSKSMKKEMNNVKEVSSLMETTQKLQEDGKTNEAIDFYRKIISLMPDNGKAYEELANIYRDRNDKNSEIEILKKGINNIENDKKTKNKLIERLKELN
ncbi:MAG: tetratricopeptide repeat protein [Methanobrevibacter sp.]|nr:tetratricopeptide repeat protein [Methanobrevibacter sp.]